MEMRLSLVLLVTLLPLGAADPPAAKAAPAKEAAPAKAAAPAAVTIPAGAVETEPGTFRFTDAQGKKWVYRKTPFGVARFEDKDDAAAAAPAPKEVKPEQKVLAVERGDMVHFERPGPFGIYKWDRKKSELSDMERKWLEEQQPNSAPAASTAEKKK